MSTLLGAVMGGGGDFIPRSVGSGVIASGTSSASALLTLTPPSGQRVRLTHLSTQAGSVQTGISVDFGAATVIGNDAISGATPNSGSRSVGSFQAYAAGTPPQGNTIYLTGKLDESVVITLGAGSTTSIIYYGYEYGE